MWAGIMQFFEEPCKLNKKAEEGQVLSLFLSWDIHFLLISEIRAPNSWPFRLQDLYQQQQPIS